MSENELLMAEDECHKKAQNLYHELEDLMCDLYVRWLDEHGYENIDDYSINLRKHVVDIGGEFVKMNKRPFGFTFALANTTYQITVSMKLYKLKKIV